MQHTRTARSRWDPGGGLGDWTQLLLANRKERLFANGLALERMSDRKARLNDELSPAGTLRAGPLKAR